MDDLPLADHATTLPATKPPEILSGGRTAPRHPAGHLPEDAEPLALDAEGDVELAAVACGPGIGHTTSTLGSTDPSEIDSAFAAISAERAGAVIVLGDTVFLDQRPRIADHALPRRLPTVSGSSPRAEVSGLTGQASLGNRSKVTPQRA